MSVTLSSDQTVGHDFASSILLDAGIDLHNEEIKPSGTKTNTRVIAITGKAGSGKTMLLAKLVKELEQLGVHIISADYESNKKERRSLAILAPTNKAASVLRQHGIAATTLHRILYTPLYDPQYEAFAKWLVDEKEKPEIEGLTEEALARAKQFYASNKSVPAALASVGLRGSDFIIGWKRRDKPLDIGMVDESSMLDETQLEDLKNVFSTLILFGDPAQLAPVGQSGKMVFDMLPAPSIRHLTHIHRQAQNNPIIQLAHALGDPNLSFEQFEQQIEDAAKHDERIEVAPTVKPELLARSPILVWRNQTRIRLINAFRTVYSAPNDELLPGEPLICDGIELPAKHRNKRTDLEARGLIKGAQAVYLGPGKKAGFSRLHVIGTDDPRLSVAAIIKIEIPNEDEPFIPFAARMGAAFLHGASCTIHKAQGSQWPEVQVFAPDLYAAARAGRTEAGIPLWKRLAYVAITRAENKLHWVTQYRMSKPKDPLSTTDLIHQPKLTKLQTQDMLPK